MTKEEFAERVDGREYPFKLSEDEERAADVNDLLVVYGCSDDLIEFRGATRHEAGAIFGGYRIVNVIGRVMEPLEDDEILRLGRFGLDELAIAGPGAFKITAIWDGGNGYSWEYETAVPHATFDVLETGEKYCRGIVIDLREVAGRG